MTYCYCCNKSSEELSHSGGVTQYYNGHMYCDFCYQKIKDEDEAREKEARERASSASTGQNNANSGKKSSGIPLYYYPFFVILSFYCAMLTLTGIFHISMLVSALILLAAIGGFIAYKIIKKHKSVWDVVFSACKIIIIIGIISLIVILIIASI